MIPEVIAGFFIGKILGALLTSYFTITAAYDGVLVMNEFSFSLCSMNFYHIILGIIVAAFIAVWKSEGIFD